MRWLCEQCGKPHPKNSPPCTDCGGMSFEKAVVQQTEGEGVKDRELTHFVWECTSCGRTSQKRNPPCTDCGGMDFEKAPLEDDGEADAGLTRRQYAAFGGALVGVLGLGAYAVLHENTPPSISDVPGSADRASGIEFSHVETGIRERLNERRADALSTDEAVSAAAAYAVKYQVKHREAVPGSDIAQFGLSDFGGFTAGFAYDESSRSAVDQYTDAPELATATVEYLLSKPSYREALLDPTYSRLGVDMHVDTDGTVYIGFVLAP